MDSINKLDDFPHVLHSRTGLGRNHRRCYLFIHYPWEQTPSWSQCRCSMRVDLFLSVWLTVCRFHAGPQLTKHCSTRGLNLTALFPGSTNTMHGKRVFEFSSWPSTLFDSSVFSRRPLRFFLIKSCWGFLFQNSSVGFRSHSLSNSENLSTSHILCSAFLFKQDGEEPRRKTRRQGCCDLGARYLLTK